MSCAWLCTYCLLTGSTVWASYDFRCLAACMVKSCLLAARILAKMFECSLDLTCVCSSVTKWSGLSVNRSWGRNPSLYSNDWATCSTLPPSPVVPCLFWKFVFWLILAGWLAGRKLALPMPLPDDLLDTRSVLILSRVNSYSWYGLSARCFAFLASAASLSYCWIWFVTSLIFPIPVWKSARTTPSVGLGINCYTSALLVKNFWWPTPERFDFYSKTHDEEIDQRWVRNKEVVFQDENKILIFNASS